MGKKKEEGPDPDRRIIPVQDGPTPVLFLISKTGPVDPLPTHVPVSTYLEDHLEGVRLAGYAGTSVLMIAGLSGRILVPANYLRHLAKAIGGAADLFEKEMKA